MVCVVCADAVCVMCDVCTCGVLEEGVDGLRVVFLNDVSLLLVHPGTTTPVRLAMARRTG